MSALITTLVKTVIIIVSILAVIVCSDYLIGSFMDYLIYEQEVLEPVSQEPHYIILIEIPVYPEGLLKEILHFMDLVNDPETPEEFLIVYNYHLNNLILIIHEIDEVVEKLITPNIREARFDQYLSALYCLHL